MCDGGGEQASYNTHNIFFDLSSAARGCARLLSALQVPKLTIKTSRLDVIKKKHVSRKIDLFEKTVRGRFIEAQFSDKQVVMPHYDGLRRGRAGDAPLVVNVGRNGLSVQTRAQKTRTRYPTKGPTRRAY